MASKVAGKMIHCYYCEVGPGGHDIENGTPEYKKHYCDMVLCVTCRDAMVAAAQAPGDGTVGAAGLSRRNKK